LVYGTVFLLLPRPPRPPLFPYTTLFRSEAVHHRGGAAAGRGDDRDARRSPELRRPAAGDEGRDLDERLEHVDAQDAAIAEERIRSEEHTSELQSRSDLVCRPLLEKKNRR